MTTAKPVRTPLDLRPSPDAWRRAEEYGLLFSHASHTVYEDLVDGGYATEAAANETRVKVIAAQGGPNGIQAIVVARIDGTWLTRTGHTPDAVLRHFHETWESLGTMPR